MNHEKLSKLPQPIIESIAGLTAGVVTTVVVHPLDLIKTRLQGESVAHKL